MRALKKLSGSQEGIEVSLDIGSSKICCVIGKYTPELEADEFINRVPDMQVLGVGIHASNGIKSGMVIDLDDAEEAIRAAVSEAERMAGYTIRDVTLPVSCGRLRSVNFAASDKVAKNQVHQSDIDRLLRAGEKYAAQEHNTILHMFPIGFRLDENGGIKDPRGMIGEELATDIHAVTVDETPLSNLLLTVENCDLNISNIIASSYASAIPTIVPDEAKLGVTCIDIGGGTTKLSVFAEGHFIYSDSIPLGGHHITLDIARSLGCSAEEAERIKTLHGSLVYARSDDQELITVARTTDPNGHDNRLTKAQLSMLIRPRVEEILSVTQERLGTSGFSAFAGSRVVLTGGGAELAGLDQFAAQYLGKPVRIGPPLQLMGLPEISAGPAFSTALGSLVYDLYAEPLFGRGFDDENEPEGSDYISQVKNWVKESF